MFNTFLMNNSVYLICLEKRKYICEQCYYDDEYKLKMACNMYDDKYRKRVDVETERIFGKYFDFRPVVNKTRGWTSKINCSGQT